MDTDSFICSMETEDFYKDIANEVESRFDTSGYPNDGSRPLPVGKNKKVIGLMKDELRWRNNERIHQLETQNVRSQLLFRSNKHEVRTLEVNKLVLSREDDKRISIDGIASYAIGHHKVWGLE